LPQSIAALLRRHRKDQTERRLKMGEDWHDGDFVFDRYDGAPMDPDRMTKGFAAAARAAKVKGVRLHDLRHAYGTTGAKTIDPATLSVLLGHSTPSFTMKTYVHPNAAMTAPMADAIEKALGEALDGM
jgi:integrase